MQFHSDAWVKSLFQIAYQLVLILLIDTRSQTTVNLLAIDLQNKALKN